MKVIVIPGVQSMSGIFHFHQIQVVLVINSLRTWVVRYFLLKIPHLQKNSTIYGTNYCHLFAANVRPPEEKPPGYKHRYKPLVISLSIISSPVISPPRYKPPECKPLDISPPYISPGYMLPVISPSGISPSDICPLVISPQDICHRLWASGIRHPVISPRI